MIGISSAAPLLKEQFFTGIVVNAALILTVALLGVKEGLLVGILPSSIALATGLLPPVLAPMVPFVILGNTILVISFGYLKNINFWAGTVVGSILKFAFLYGMSFVVIGLLVNKSIAGNISAMMSWPQLITAIGGSIVAYGTLRLIKK